ncbi:hypothetical protein CLV84_0997 [Neolewinella xylanilytica]|uniref:Uncharacterized protein n=1 Tax=Neolewinella xylanilytica TaxID=1514080 RepID=A0A2S6I955_9BACT|nr:hypothetical protein [Neolewinella xylanilytica]PPK88034.1 hypothetical protein CLV84_0997 [Neolewinella xylanilytica]
MPASAALSAVLLLLLLIGCGEPGAKTPIGAPPPPRDPPATLTDREDVPDAADTLPLARIRDRYARVQRLLDGGTVRADTLRTNCRNQDGEFFLVRYFDGADLIMLRTTTGIGHAFTTKRMYFDDGTLFFAWRQDEQFGPADPPDGSEDMGWTSEYTETRYYVADGVVIRQLTKTYETQSWNDTLSSDAIPNTPVEAAEGKPFPDGEALADWKRGKVDC